MLDPPFLRGDLRAIRPDRLSEEAEHLIAARLRGTFKVPKGKPRQTEARRRIDNPIHDADDEVEVIREILEKHFPDRKSHHERAIDVAARRAGIRYERLANHLRSPYRLKR